MRSTFRQWDPFRELNRLQREMKDVFPFGGFPAIRRRTEFPAVNVLQNADSLVLTAELPGLNPDELDITITGDSLTLRGRRSDQPLREGDTFYRRERSADPFVCTLELPFEIDPDHTEATYEKGVLTLTLHRPEAQKPKKVTVKAG